MFTRDQGTYDQMITRVETVTRKKEGGKESEPFPTGVQENITEMNPSTTEKDGRSEQMLKRSKTVLPTKLSSSEANTE